MSSVDGAWATNCPNRLSVPNRERTSTSVCQSHVEFPCGIAEQCSWPKQGSWGNAQTPLVSQPKGGTKYSPVWPSGAHTPARVGGEGWVSSRGPNHRRVWQMSSPIVRRVILKERIPCCLMCHQIRNCPLWEQTKQCSIHCCTFSQKGEALDTACTS